MRIHEFVFEKPDYLEALELYKKAGIYNDQWTQERMRLTLENSSLLLCCYDSNKLIGILRGVTDFHWIAHISHLAVDPDYQRKGIGRTLIEKAKQFLGDGVALMVHSDPKAKAFYEKLAFEVYDDVYRIPRKK